MALISINRIGDARVRSVNNNLDGETDLVFRVRTDTNTDAQEIVLAGSFTDPISGMTIPQPWAVYGKPWTSQAEDIAAQAITPRIRAATS